MFIIKKIIPIVFILLFVQCTTTNNQLDITPKPIEIATKSTYFHFDDNTVINIENDTQVTVAWQLADLFSKPTGFTPEIRITPANYHLSSINFYTDTTIAPEHYILDINPIHIRITAADNGGFFYAVQTIRMMLPPEIESKTLVPDMKWKIRSSTIKDGPRFPYRGMMLDVARTFIPKENILKLIDGMAMLKLNRLHLHLTDDNGWRLEIKKYPELTKIGAWRVERSGDFPQRRNPVKGEPTPIGGFYTQKEMKEIIDYAADKNVEIIPEIEMPAHSNAALAAYPSLACPVVKDFIGVLPGLGGDAAKHVYCAGNEDVFRFLEDVIDEVSDIFPSSYIHIGGDEASKYYWEKCPLCKKRMKKEGITNIEDLQGYFVNRMAEYIKSKGKQVIGWDELTNSTIPDGTIICGWREMGEAGYKAGLQGHPFIMSPANVLYLIRYQGPQWFEPRTYFGNNTLKDVYDYEPVQKDWKPEAIQNLIGMEACLWTEFLRSPEDTEYLLFPRLAAFAETAWSPEGTKDWTDFLKRLDYLTQHYDIMGINYAHSMYNLDHSVKGTHNVLNVSLSCIRPDVEIRYTTDESEPVATSPIYSDTLSITGNTTIKAATFVGEQQKGETLVLPLLWNKATTCPVICKDNNDAYRLTNSIRGSDKYTDSEWCGWYNQDTSFIIDLQKEETIHKVTIGCITNYGMAVHIPKYIRLALSNDGTIFTTVREKTFTTDEIFREGIRTEDKIFDNINATGKYLKVELGNPGICPKDHVRPGQNTWVYIDEVIVD